MKKRILAVALLCGYHLTAQAENLSAWNDTQTKHEIEQWVQGAVKEGSSTFIPKDERYVVFDNDGTLWPEAPLTFQLQFVVDEIKRLAPEHPEWKTDPLVSAVLNNDKQAIVNSGQKGLVRLISLTHSGITTDEFEQRVHNWLNNKRDKRTGCRYDQMGYLPMQQLLNYLRSNGFKTWIVSGGGIDFMRVMSQKMYGIPPEQVIGSFTLGEYSLKENNTQINKTMKGAYLDDAANKPVAIHVFMGHRPVAAFGNSDGDVSMLQYTTANTKYHTFGLLIHHTDSLREYAYDNNPPASGKLINGLTEAKKNGWTIVDIKKDWSKIYNPEQCFPQ
jgi:phosphoglycolate phosphatase-like HAD superfamily hydrolase